MKCEVLECNNDATEERAGGWTICSACIEEYYMGAIVKGMMK